MNKLFLNSTVPESGIYPPDANPSRLGFRMPAEWRTHDFTLMSWPVRPATWLEGIELAREGYIEVANAIADYEPLIMIAGSSPDREAGIALALKKLNSDIELWDLPHDDSWLRDNGPTFVLNSDSQPNQIAAINWRFNAWGEKQPFFADDDRLAPLILERLGVPRFDAPLILEGGSIHSDGEGTILTTSECLLAPNRNPKLSQANIEELLKLYLGSSTIIWLPKGLKADETDGHVDNLACFVKPGLIVLQTASDPALPDYETSQAALAVLADSRDAAGRVPEVVTIPAPPPRYLKSQRLILSYLNYYPVNGALIVPVFGGRGDYELKQADDQALGILRDLYPERQIVSIDGLKIVHGGGNVHCITQQGYGRSCL